MRIKLPATRKGRIWASIGTAVAVFSIVGGISDATQSDSDRQYKACMEAYHDAKHCYEDVYNHRPNIEPQAPTDDPTVPPTSWNPVPAKHFHFCFDCPLDPSQVVDLRG